MWHVLLRLGFVIVLCSVSCAPPHPSIPKLLGRIEVPPLGAGNSVVTFDPKTGYIYLAHGEFITVITGTEIVAQIPIDLMSRPMNIGGVNATGRIYIPYDATNKFVVVKNKSIEANITIEGWLPRDLAVDNTSNLVYIASTAIGHKSEGELIGYAQDGRIEIISDTQVVNVIALNQLPATQVEIDQLHQLIYVGAINRAPLETGDSAGAKILVFSNFEKLYEYDFPRQQVTDMTTDSHTGNMYAIVSDSLYQFQVGQVVISATLPAPLSPGFVRVNPTTNKVYVAGGEHVWVFQDMQLVADIAMDCLAYKMEIDPIAGNVYIVCPSIPSKTGFADGQKVVVINNLEKIAEIDVGGSPINLAINPTTGWVYVPAAKSSTVAVLGIP